MVKNITAVIAENKAAQQRAAALNIRAGEDIFPVLGLGALQEWLASRLQGARSLGEIADPAALRLPEPDAELVALVLSENPDTIVVADREFPVAYQKGLPPTIRLENALIQAGFCWLLLPDEGITLPGGRPVRVVFMTGAWQGTGYDSIPLLKGAVREHLNLKQWEGWVRPNIELPDLAVEHSGIPEIAQAEYGRCVATGEVLVAYGTAAINIRRYYASEPWFTAVWLQDQDEAATMRERAVAKLSELKQAAKEQAVVLELQEVAGPLARQITSIYSAGCITGERGASLSQFYANLRPTNADGLRAWIAEAQAFVAEAGEINSEAERQREAAARLKEQELLREEQELAVLTDNGITFDQARFAKAFAEAAVSIAGQHALAIIDAEAGAPYGYAGRQFQIRQNLPGIELTEAGARFLYLGRARDVNAILMAAVTWLMTEEEIVKEQNVQEVAEVPGETSAQALAAAWGASFSKKKGNKN